MDQGEKIFWVCPLINKSKRLNYMDVKTRYDELCKRVDKDKILLLHGKMKQEKKDAILQEFRDNPDKKILVEEPHLSMHCTRHGNDSPLPSLHSRILLGNQLF